MVRIEQLARLHQEDLLHDAARGRLAQTAGGRRRSAGRRREAGSGGAVVGLRRGIARLLIAAGTWLAAGGVEREASDGECA